MALRDHAERGNEEGIGRLLAAYQVFPGGYDEMVGADGRPRAHWRPLLSMLAGLGPEEVGRRFGAAERHLRESGVFYRVYEDTAGAERPWPLSAIPLLIESSDWRALRAAAIQRATLLETVLADCYGQAQLVRDGRLPAALVAGNPEFLRPLVGVRPAGGAHLRLYALDVGRAPDGRWWVLGDRMQAPSGSGYALENRLALGRAMPDLYRAMKVERLAPYFQAMQADLTALNKRDDSRVCLLTPGPLNDIYFEHAYLARYLGFLLVEGEDLTVRENGVFIRTVSGLKRAEVILRRLDSDFADPLELNARSRLGVPGLLRAIRDGQVVIANALGSGLMEARAFLSFLPALAPAVLNEPLALANVATWWLGQKPARAQVLERLSEMVVGSAFSGDVPGFGDRRDLLGATLDTRERSRLEADIERRGIDYVAQENVKLSTMPVWNGGRLEPRPFTLRLFLSRSGEGWTVMPGGFVRIAERADARAVSMQRGGLTADAWVLSDGPVAETTLLPTPDRIVIRRATGALQSRAADNLLWCARYVERTEATLRLIRALINRETDGSEADAPVMTSIASLLWAWSAVPQDVAFVNPALAGAAALRNRDLPGALPQFVATARNAASLIRDRFSPDAWRALTDLAALIDAPFAPMPAESAIFERIYAALRIIASFSGLAQENMTQLAGWRFLELGRRIERAIVTCRFVRQFGVPGAPEGSLDALLELADSQITYRLRYVMVAARAPVIDLVVLDPSNPRSLAFQLDRIETHLAALPRQSDAARLSPPAQIAASLATLLRTIEVAAVDDALLADIENRLMLLSDSIAQSYFTLRDDRADASWEVLG
ncbi:MAG: circularly permuted type 2 ATP-grasp protein [Pseudorhodoplanes sp.]